MKRILPWVIVFGTIAILYMLYQSNRSANHLNYRSARRPRN